MASYSQAIRGVAPSLTRGRTDERPSSPRLVPLYEQLGLPAWSSAAAVRKADLAQWWRRYQAEARAGCRSTASGSSSPQRKVFAREEALISAAREASSGIKQLAHELHRENGCSLPRTGESAARHGESSSSGPAQAPRPEALQRPVQADRVRWTAARSARALPVHASPTVPLPGLASTHQDAQHLDFLERVADGMQCPGSASDRPRREVFDYPVQGRLRDARSSTAGQDSLAALERKASVSRRARGVMATYLRPPSSPAEA